MDAICSGCSLPMELCICQEIAKEQQRALISVARRRYGKLVTIVEGIDDTAIDLAVICSILSSDQDIALDTQICFAGEVGLSGEIRAVNRIEQRIAEAEKLGYKKIVISKYNKLNSHRKITY